jgi:flavin reductase (DIM6/NTAB) family NADH-FMN oxidoreductase RutF
MKRTTTNLSKGIWALPPFPLVLVTVAQNIMTAGAFHFYSFEPPEVMVGIMPERFTYELLLQEGEFGINLPGADQVWLARACGSHSGRQVGDKYRQFGVTPFPGSCIHTCLIQECPVNIECRVVHRVDHPGTHCWFIGAIQAVHLDDDYQRDKALMFWSDEYRKVGDLLERA